MLFVEPRTESEAIPNLTKKIRHLLLYRVLVPSVAHHLDGLYISLEKAFCDKEMAETEAKKADNEADIEKLSTKIDSMTAKSSKLKGQVAALQAELAALARTQAEADKLRAEETHGAGWADIGGGLGWGWVGYGSDQLGRIQEKL